MGNTSSRVRDNNRVFLMLSRTWAIVVPDLRTRRNETRNSTTEISDVGSQYSFCTCSQCDKNWGSDSTSDLFGPTMAPNSDENGRHVLAKNKKNWGEDTLSRDKQRPPLYNPEDYSSSLRKWSRKTGIYTETPGVAEAPGIQQPSTGCKDYRNPMLTESNGEMTLRGFGTLSELLVKLRGDLKLAFPSFVQEFISDPLDGIALLLDILRCIQLSQACAPGPASTRLPPAAARRALLDELACLQCLQACCGRDKDGVRRVLAAGGCNAIAVGIMSQGNRTRIIALELLTKACEPPFTAHTQVSEALSTLRLRFGEPVRFRFLVGMLTSAGQCELLTAGLRFLNTFLNTSGNLQRRLYIQAELEQAGFDIDGVKKIVNINSQNAEIVFQEIDKWEKEYINIDSVSKKCTDVEKENGNLKEKITLLERRVQILQEEKGVLINLEQCLKERCCELQDEVTSLKSSKPKKSIAHSRNSSIKIGNSSPNEDEGISSSERSLSPDDQREPLVYELYNVQTETLRQPAVKEKEEKGSEDPEEEETTIEEVIEELRNIINDAETEEYNKEEQKRNKIQMRVDLIEDEDEIIPSFLHPQPPRRTRSLVHLYIPTEEYEYHQKEMYFENETQFISDESSDSLLSASKCQIIENNNRELLNTIMDARDKAIQQEKRRQKKYELLKSLKTNPHIIESKIDMLYKQKSQKQSKSLDRIEDGLDAMVDIIVTKDQPIEKSDSGHVTETSMYSHVKKFSKAEEKHKIFLPIARDINETSFYFPRVQENANNFLIKRGHVNAGLYSGHVTRDAGSKKPTISSRGTSRNVSLGKLTDLPSGLY